MLRKINAVISLLATLLIISHSFLTSVAPYIPNMSESKIPAIVLSVLVVLHAVLSMVAVATSGNGMGSYPKAQKQTAMQRLSGMLTILVMLLHIGVNIMMPKSVLSIVMVMLVSLVSLLHVKMSVAKALVTLGITTNEKTVAVIEKISVIFFTVLTVFILVMFAIRLVGALR